MRREQPDFRPLIRAAMQSRGVTHQALADAVGMQRQHITRWLSGKRRIGDDKLAAIADALDLELRESLGA